MDRALALFLGVLAWAAVAAVAVLMVHFFEDDNQILAFTPILLAVIVAWAIGEVVTRRVFGGEGQS